MGSIRRTSERLQVSSTAVGAPAEIAYSGSSENGKSGSVMVG